MDPEELRIYQESLDSIPFHQTLGVALARIQPTVELTMTASDGLAGLGTALHGGALAALVDIAAGIEAGTKATGYDPLADGLVTIDTHLQFRAQPRTPTVTAEARLVQQVGTLLRIECSVTDGNGRLVAAAAVNSVVLPKRHRRRGVQLSEQMLAANALHESGAAPAASDG